MNFVAIIGGAGEGLVKLIESARQGHIGSLGILVGGAVWFVLFVGLLVRQYLGENTNPRPPGEDSN